MFDFALVFAHIVGRAQVLFSSMNVNILDVIIVLVILFYAYEGYTLGFVLAFSDLMSFVFALVPSVTRERRPCSKNSANSRA